MAVDSVVLVESPNGHINGGEERPSRLAYIRLGDLVTAEKSQREYRPAWANQIASDLKFEGIGFPVVNRRNGVDYLVDGQHRVAALRIFGYSADYLLLCELFEGLNEVEEARLFLKRNNMKSVSAVDVFRVSLNGNLMIETEIDYAVRSQDLRTGKGGITAVGTLRAVYRQVGGIGLSKTLRIIRDSYGKVGFSAAVIDGIGLCVHRYGDLLLEEVMINALATTAGGLNGLLTQAEKTRYAIGQTRPQCIAATAVGLYNRSHPAPKKKLISWWKE